MEIPKELDWVAARAACSVDALFESLAQIIESDVSAIRKVDARSIYRFRHPATSLNVSVTRETDQAVFVRAVILTRDRRSITVTTRMPGDEFHPLFVAMPRLDETGACRLEIDGNPMELWQVSRRALEELFFDD